jgi:hypothetical protein
VRSPQRRSAQASRDASPGSRPLSRRSSPPVHPDRARHRSPGANASYKEASRDRRSDEYYSREVSPRRARSPVRSPQEASHYRERSPVRDEPQYHDRSPPQRNRTSAEDNQAFSKGSTNYENESRPPPSGPNSSRYDNYSRDAPPTGPSYRGEPVPQSNNGPIPNRGPRPGGSYRENSFRGDSGRGGRYNGPSQRSPPQVPTGPRGSSSSYDTPPNSGRWSSQNNQRWDRSAAPAFRGSNNSTSTTYPRTQRFNTATSHLASVPSVVEGGKKLPSLVDPEHERKLSQLEEEKKKLEAQIEEKQRAKRQSLREWDKLERESKRDALRSELAEGHLERLSGDNMSASGGTY